MSKNAETSHLPEPQRQYESSRLIFRAREVSQAVELYHLIDRNRDHLRPWMDWLDKTLEVNHTFQYIEMISAKWDKKSTFDYSVFEKSSGQLIGSFGFHTIDWSNFSCHLGYWISQEHQGKGFISEALRESESWAKELGFKKLYLTCDPENTRSRNCALRNGYHQESATPSESTNKKDRTETLWFSKLL